MPGRLTDLPGNVIKAIHTHMISTIRNSRHTSLVFTLLSLLIGVAWSCSDLGVDDRVIGGNPKAIPVDTQPTWSPDGQWIAYFHRSVDYSDSVYPSGLYVIDATGARRRLVLQGSWIQTPAWSPLGDRIAFSAGGTEIMTITPSGQALAQITQVGEAFFPSWSPDGRRLAFDGDYFAPNSGNGICLINADGTGLTDISQHGTGEWRNASWSPDGTKLVHSRFIGVGTPEIFVMDTAGRSPQRLTFNTAEDWSPSYSHDGRTIVWTQDDASGAWISLMDSDGKNQRHLVVGAYPAWSPDGRWIVFSWYMPSHDKYVLWIIRPDGTGLKQLTQ